MKIALLPTGRTEWHGLPRALQRLFPADPPHQFYALPTAAEVFSNPEDFPYPGFTSNPVSERHASEPPENALELVERAAQAAVGDRCSAPADLVLVLDDLELVNAGRAELVCRIFRAAAARHLEGLTTQRIAEVTRKALLTRVSFHLVVPMIEALFFADAAALSAAGVADDSPEVLLCRGDPEDFRTSDAAYLADGEAACPCWSELPSGRAKKKLRPKWLGSARERHPKGYLQWLCRDGTAKNCTRYDETRSGSRALTEIDWQALLARPNDHFLYLRSLVADIADALNQPPTAGSIHDPQASATSRFASGLNRLLRNL